MDIKNYKNSLQKIKQSIKLFDANIADIEAIELKKMFDSVYDSGVLDITHLDKKTQDKYKLELFTILSNSSGTLAFLVIQILAANNIMAKNNYHKKQHYLEKKCGIAINHLRAPITIVSGKKVDGGYILNGILNWASGYQIFDTLLIGFHYEGFELEAMADFIQKDNFHIQITPDTFVGFGLNTVNVELRDFFVPDENIVSKQNLGNYTKVKSASKTVHFCLYGLGVSAFNNTNNEDFKQIGLDKLEKIKDKFMDSNDINELDNLRVELFCLVQDIVTTAMILNGGKSVLSNQHLQRIYRELIMFNSNGLNNTLKDMFKQRFLNV